MFAFCSAITKGDSADIQMSVEVRKWLTISLNVSISASNGSIAIQHDKNTTSTATNPATITSKWRSLMAWDKTKNKKCQKLILTLNSILNDKASAVLQTPLPLCDLDFYSWYWHSLGSLSAYFKNIMSSHEEFNSKKKVGTIHPRKGMRNAVQNWAH